MLAVAGTGKTKALTARSVVHLMNTGDTLPGRIEFLP